MYASTVEEWVRRTHEDVSRSFWGGLEEAGFTIAVLRTMFGKKADSLNEQFVRWTTERLRPYIKIRDGDNRLAIRVGGEADISGDPLTLLLDLSMCGFYVLGLQLLHQDLQATPLQKWGLHFTFHLTGEDLVVRWLSVPSRERKSVRLSLSSLYNPDPPYKEEIRISQPTGSYIFKLPSELWPPSLYCMLRAI